MQILVKEITEGLSQDTIDHYETQCIAEYVGKFLLQESVAGTNVYMHFRAVTFLKNIFDNLVNELKNKPDEKILAENLKKFRMKNSPIKPAPATPEQKEANEGLDA